MDAPKRRPAHDALLRLACVACFSVVACSAPAGEGAGEGAGGAGGPDAIGGVGGFGAGGAGGGGGGIGGIGAPDGGGAGDAAGGAPTDGHGGGTGPSDGGGQGPGDTPGVQDTGALADAAAPLPDGSSVGAADAADTGAAGTADGADADLSTDAAGAACLFIPPPGDFSPILECFWKKGTEAVAYDDVVMTPAVANLTDDDLDGDIDLDDIPEIAFATYRYQEDGCCKVPAVLRLVRGRCERVSDGEPQPLDEILHVKSPKLDNTGGLAIGDLDADGSPDVVGMLHKEGTVAFTAVLPAPAPVTALDAAGFVLGGNAGPLEAVAEPVPDDATTLSTTTKGKELWVTPEWALPADVVAIAEVRLVVRAHGPDPFTLATAVIRKGGKVAQATPRFLPAGQPGHVAWAFPRDAFGGDVLWTAASLAGVELGLRHEGPDGAAMTVSHVAVEARVMRQKWKSPHPSVAGGDLVTGAQPSIADLDGDGDAEVLVGRVVLDGATGELLWKGKAGVGVNSFLGPISTAADLDLAGDQEVIAGPTVYDSAGEALWTLDFGQDGSGCDSGGLPCDGFNAVGDFDGDPEGEVVVVREGVVYVLHHDGALLAKATLPKDDCKWNEGGPPTVADFDGDGQREIGVAGSDYYAVFDLECCASLPDCTAAPAGAPCSDPGIRWKVPNFDCSSRVTGSSVFDFDGDGASEVVYNDEKHFRIFRGADGQILFEEANTSHTRLEYPVIVDTDNDGNAEIVFIENGAGGNGDPSAIQIWGDAADHWVPTRRIWNQHTYHITSVTEDGRLPPGGELPNWLGPNNFRQNLPDFDPFLAPDLHVVALPAEGCAGGAPTLRAKVCNEGGVWVTPGYGVGFYDAATGEALPCAPKITATLQPGQCTVVTCQAAAGGFVVCVDGFDAECAGPGWVSECDEQDNRAEGAGCP